MILSDFHIALDSNSPSDGWMLSVTPRTPANDKDCNPRGLFNNLASLSTIPHSIKDQLDKHNQLSNDTISLIQSKWSLVRNRLYHPERLSSRDFTNDNLTENGVQPPVHHSIEWMNRIQSEVLSILWDIETDDGTQRCS